MTAPHIDAQINSLLESLAKSDLLERQIYLSEIASLGHEAIPAILDAADYAIAEIALREVITGLNDEGRERACTYLVRALRRDRDARVRLLALTMLGDRLHDLTGFIDKTVEISVDGSESSELRTRALRTLRAATLEREHVRDLAQLLDVGILGSDCPAQFREAAFACLETHAAQLAVGATMKQLDKFLIHPAPDVRVCALNLLGEIGDIDAIERMCMMPNTQAEIEQIQAAMGNILKRPTNLLSLRWEHFEHFVGHLLRKMGHMDVEVTRSVRDNGFDVVSYKQRDNLKGPVRERWVVQCKRWATNDVDLNDVEAMVQCSREQDAKHALLVTTSGFTKRALEYEGQHGAAIELVSGVELLAILDTHFGPGRYAIQVRD
ncbi:hypothetical protein DB30_00149 [Enhygromyxa salina]|uniref:Restriction endonuclease type IV Mrr domain-containing protein n=1 Tax=Enhygromyxa salina TaxID=215803 RepID=A0A0C2DDX2_9BACT|nr:restriction endonuclease [Enhygromyxa salina]KIG19640.1 hypothetical protein DB30_00149 [Enhygromyxa salina]